MKVLIAPMAAIAETSGPFGRAKALAIGLLHQGYTPAFCAAKEITYQRVEGIQEYFAPIPSPTGLPMAIGKRAFIVAQRIGVQQRRKVHSFEEVLFIVGAIQEHFFAEDIATIRKVIREFKPDVVYAEFRPAAIVAAKLENLPVAISYSYTARKAYASSPQDSGGVRRFLRQNGMGDIESVLDIFEWADLKFVPSCYELEPIDDPEVISTGPFNPPRLQPSNHTEKNAIIAYMGNGSIPHAKQLSVLKQAFRHTQYQIYIASDQAEPADEGNMNVARRFDFNSLFPCAATFIHHGGQNSILAGIMAGVPQIVFPGNVFERQYNADSITRLGIGKSYLDSEFSPSHIVQAVQAMQGQKGFLENIYNIQTRLTKLGGTDTVIRSITAICAN